MDEIRAGPGEPISPAGRESTRFGSCAGAGAAIVDMDTGLCVNVMISGAVVPEASGMVGMS
jgi:hypothetical protein